MSLQCKDDELVVCVGVCECVFSAGPLLSLSTIMTPFVGFLPKGISGDYRRSYRCSGLVPSLRRGVLLRNSFFFLNPVGSIYITHPFWSIEFSFSKNLRLPKKNLISFNFYRVQDLTLRRDYVSRRPDNVGRPDRSIIHSQKCIHINKLCCECVAIYLYHLERCYVLLRDTVTSFCKCGLLSSSCYYYHYFPFC